MATYWVASSNLCGILSCLAVCPARQRKCLGWIDRFRADGALLFVSHSTAEMICLCHRAIWIDDGRIREAGTPKEVVRSYEHAMAVELNLMDRFSAI